MTCNSLKLTEIYPLSSNYYSISSDIFHVVTNIGRVNRETFFGDSYSISLNNLVDSFCKNEWFNCFDKIKYIQSEMSTMSADWQLISPLTSMYACSSNSWDSFYSTLCTLSTCLATYNQIYPVGSIHVTLNGDITPTNLFPGTNWIPFGSGRVIVGVDEESISNTTCFNTVKKCGGEYNVKLGEITPNHRHIAGLCTFQCQNVFIGSTFNVAGCTQLNECNSGYDIIFPSSFGRPSNTRAPHNNIQPVFGVCLWTRIS